MAVGWRRWFVRAGRLRSGWRVLLFGMVFLAILQLELLFLPWLAEVDAAEGRVTWGLVGQMAAVLVAALAAGRALLRWVDRQPGATLGFHFRRRVPLELGLGVVIGAGGLLLVVLVLAAVGAYRYGPEPGSVQGWLSVAGASLAAFAIPAAAEEALFRGYMLQALREGAGAAVAVVVTTALFALAHGANPNVTGLGLVNIFLAGALLAVAVLRTGSLWFATAVHLGWNWIMAGPLDLPVSGLESYDAPFYDVTGTGAAWLTGGAFGPEGGLAGTAAAALVLMMILWTTRPGAALAGPPGIGRHASVEDR